jgi:hypothetical protein
MRGGGSLRWQSGALGPVLRREVDVVVAEGDPHCLSALVAFAACRLLRIAFIVWWHAVGQQSLRWLSPLRLAWARRASALAFSGPERREWFTELGIPAQSVFVTWNTIDTDTIAGPAAPWSAAQRHRVLYVGCLIAALSPEGTALVALCDQPNAETRIAQAVARTVGREHRPVVRPRDWYPAIAQRLSQTWPPLWAWVTSALSLRSPMALGSAVLVAALLSAAAGSYCVLSSTDRQQLERLISVQFSVK